MTPDWENAAFLLFFPISVFLVLWQEASMGTLMEPKSTSIKKSKVQKFSPLILDS